MPPAVTPLRNSPPANPAMCSGNTRSLWKPTPIQNETPTSVVADEPCRTMVLPLAARRWLEQHEERLALKLYSYLLAGRFAAESEAGQEQEDSGSREEST